MPVITQALKQAANPIGALPDCLQGTTPKVYLVHGDLGRHNLYQTECGICLLDWEFAASGDPAFEVADLFLNGHLARKVSFTPESYDFVDEVNTPECIALIGNNRAEPTTEFVPVKNSEDAQPFGDGTVFVSHNGTIANDKELRADYGIRTDSRIDSAVLPGLIRQCGIRDALAKVRGSFALAVVDSRQPQKLYLARNYKPLFLQAVPEVGAIFFASRPGHLAPPQGVGASLFERPVVAVPAYSLLEIDGSTMEIHQEELSKRKRSGRALVICSGGLDSTTAAKWEQLQGYEVTLLHFLYRCRAQEREMEAVRSIAQALGCAYRFEDLEWLGRLGGSSLTDTALPVTENEMSAEFAHEWVPARNLIMSLAWLRPRSLSAVHPLLVILFALDM